MADAGAPAKSASSSRKALQEYLEKYATDGLKREIDYEEAVWRSLPAFITSLGLLAALLAFSFSIILSDLPAPLAIVGAALILLASVSGSLTIWQLRFSLRRQRHRYPPAETAICKYADQQRTHFQEHGEAGIDVEEAVLDSVRKFVLSEIAEAATNNHTLNASKLTARTEAARWLFWTTVSTLAAGASAALVKFYAGV